MVSRKQLLLVALVAFFAIAAVSAEDSSSSSASESKEHPKNVKKHHGKKDFLSPEKFKAILQIYEGEGSIEEKNKKVDELTASYSEGEKKAVEGIKKHAAHRAELFAKLSDEAKAILKEIHGLRKQEHELLKKIDKKDRGLVHALLSNGHHSGHKSPVGGKKPHHKSTGEARATTAAASA